MSRAQNRCTHGSTDGSFARFVWRHLYHTSLRLVRAFASFLFCVAFFFDDICPLTSCFSVAPAGGGCGEEENSHTSILRSHASQWRARKAPFSQACLLLVTIKRGWTMKRGSWWWVVLPAFAYRAYTTYQQVNATILSPHENEQASGEQAGLAPNDEYIVFLTRCMHRFETGTDITNV